MPYEFTNTLSSAEQQTYLNALREWELVANVKFVARTSQTRWILFTYHENGPNSVSSTDSPQVVSVSSLSRAQICHEMGHSFGLTHENIRPDRDQYITVLTNNIANAQENLSWFDIDPASVTNGVYDFESVMHLGWDFASLGPGVLPTQEPKQPFLNRYRYRMGNYCLSSGDRAAIRYLYGPPAEPITNVVTTTADTGSGSMRAALYYVADNPGSEVLFDLPPGDPGFSNGVFSIYPTGFLPPLAVDGIRVNGFSQPGFTDRPLIVVNGSRILPQTFSATSGLLIYSASNEIRGLSIQGFEWNGITLHYGDATNNTIAGCWIGLDHTGASPAGNAFQGILIAQGARNNIIGGTNTADRNVISGNKGYGVFVTDAGTGANIILGNYIGTDAEGNAAVPNEFGGAIFVNHAKANVVGGAAPGSRNIISGNADFGLWIGDHGTSGNLVQGNFVGLNQGGSGPLPNTFTGMYIIHGAQSNLVSGNVFSGQPSEGLRIEGAGTSHNTIQGNYFGTDSTGTVAVPNGFAGLTVFGGASSNLLGGAFSSARNLISGNGSYGLVVGDPGSDCNTIVGNWMGLDAGGTNGLPNAFANVALWNGASRNSIGSIALGEGNTIAHSWIGVVLYDDATTNNAIRGNAIFDHDGLGLDLNGDGVTTNHAHAIPGPNAMQSYPVLTNAFANSQATTIAGFLSSNPDRHYWIDVYRNPVAHSSDHGEGQFYFGTAFAQTDANGAAYFSLVMDGDFEGHYFSATASDVVTGDTSEFSRTLQATNSPSAPAFLLPFSYTSAGLSAPISVEIGQHCRIQAATNLAAPPVNWTDLTNFTATTTNFFFLDPFASNYPVRFYRVASP